MIHVLIDTSILRQDPQRKSAAFQVLAKLGNWGELTLHIPYFVRHEFLSQRKEEYSGSLWEVERVLIKVANKPLKEDLKNSLGEQLAGLQATIPNIDEWIEQEFDLWCGHVGAENHPIKEHHGQRVAEAYFSGQPPFKEAKAREDIPDAFILETVRDVLAGIEQLNVVVGDKRLREACQKLQNVIVYSTLNEFIKSDQCQEALKDTDVAENFEAICKGFNQHIDMIGEVASTKLFDELVGYTFSDPSIPDDNNEATISMLDVPTNIGLDFEESEYYGGGVIVVPFEFEMTVIADYYIFKSDYYVLDEKRAESISVSEYDNRHYYEAGEEFNLAVRGKIAISLYLATVPPGKKVSDYIDAVTENSKIEVSEIEDVSVIHDEESYF